MSNIDAYPEQLHEPNLGRAEFVSASAAAQTAEIKPAAITRELEKGEATFIQKPFPLTDEVWRSFLDRHMKPRSTELPAYTVSGIAQELVLMSVPQAEALRVGSELVLALQQQQEAEAQQSGSEIIPPPPDAPPIYQKVEGGKVVWSGKPGDKAEFAPDLMKIGELTQALQAINSMESAQMLVDQYNRQWSNTYVETVGVKAQAVPLFEVVLDGKHYGMSRKFGPNNSEYAVLVELVGE